MEACWPNSYPAVAVIETYDGRTLRGKVDFPKGDPENPVTNEELVAKFKYLAKDRVNEDDIEQIIATVMNLEASDNIATLMKMLSGK